MAGRPRQYATAAEKMAAYRLREQQRTMPMDRLTVEELESVLIRLVDAVHQAQRAGDPFACSLNARSRPELLSDLAAYFEAHSSNQS